MSYKGKFIPSNRKKYRGDINNIIYRSLWERKFMVHCDTKPEIIEWGSEEIIIPYISPLDRKRHRYFPDFYIKTNNGDKFMIEIKPKKFTKPPRATKRVTKAFLHETKEWARNCAKWTAAKAVCDRQGWKFLIFTEDHLNMTKYLYGR
jgi:hypothetical protein